MTRGRRKKEEDAGPERTCIVSGKSVPKADLLRFVVAPDGRVAPDILGKLPGRGIYVSPQREMIEKAATKGGFARAAKAPVQVPEGLADEVERQLAARVVNLVSLTRKAGLAVCGFEKVKGWLESRRIRVLLQASDGSERGKGKLWTPEGARYFGCLTGEEIGMAFGRQTAIHAALTAGGLSDRVVEEASKLKGLREVAVGDGANGKRMKS